MGGARRCTGSQSAGYHVTMADLRQNAPDPARARLRRLAHAIGIGFAVFTFLAIFSITGDLDILYALMAAAGLGASVWLAALWYVDRNRRAR